jgi:hypothetical protein
MTKIGSLFANDVSRTIEEVIKVDQADEDVIAGEIAEYVATDSIKRSFIEVLEAYQEAPQKPREGAAVWVSGFFGSGKSSFAKLLGLALENRTIKGLPAADRFAKQIGDNRLSVVLKTIGEKIPTHAVIFDVSTDRGIRSGDQMLTEIMYRLFLESLGYAKDIDLAELEIDLESAGRLEAFEAAFKSQYGSEWRDDRSLLSFAIGRASTIMSQLDPTTFPAADSWGKTRAKPNVTTGLFGERVVELMERRKKGQSLLFVVDEVGQFVARDVQKMLDLQAIVQQLGLRGRGKFWTVVTSQEKLSELVSGLDDKKIELARLMDRFPIQVHLDPSDIAEVTSKRVLQKDAKAEATLGKLYDDNRARLDVNSRISADVRLPSLSREGFVDLYPLLPYQIDLVIDIVSGLRLQGGASRHVGGANRTIIKLAQQLLINPATEIAEMDVGSLVRLDQVYDLISGNISSDIRQKIESIPARVRHPLAQSVAKVVCLFQFVKTVHRTPENIAAALVAGVDADSPLVAVRDALGELEKSQFVRQGDDGYRIPTPAEDDWDKTRQGIAPRRADERQMLSATISEFWSPQPEFNLGDTKLFRAGLMVDGVEKVSGEIYFHLQLGDNAEGAAIDAEALRTRSQNERDRVFWSVALDEDIIREARESYRSDEMIKTKARGAATADETKLIAEEKARQRRSQQELQRRLRAACLSGKIYFQGNDRSPGGGATDLRKAATAVLSQALPTVYDRFREASAKRQDITNGVKALLTDENLNGLPKVFAELGLIRDEGGKRVLDFGAGPLSEVFAKIDDRARYGDLATGKFLTEAFASAPYGWDFDAVRLFTLSLLRAGVIEGSCGGQTLDVATSVAAQDCFNNNPQFRVATFRPKKSIDFGVVAEAARHFKETFGVEAKELAESPLAAEIRQQIDNQTDSIQRALDLVRIAGLSGSEMLASAVNEMRNISRGGDGNAITAFNASHRLLKDAIRRSGDLIRSLDETGQSQVEAGRRALRELAYLLQEPDIDPGFKETGETLGDLLAKETFFRELTAISAAAATISQEQARRRGLAVMGCTEAYKGALKTLASTPGWEQLGADLQALIAQPLQACATGDGTGKSLSELRMETETCPGRLETAVRKVLETIEGDRLATVSAGQYFSGGIETEEQLDQALTGLRDELSRLIGEGKKVVVR